MGVDGVSVKGDKLPVTGGVGSADRMYSMLTVINCTILYTENS